MATTGSRPGLKIDAGLATLTLQRPDQANRLDDGDLHTLLEHFASINRLSSVRAVLLCAEGRHFCAGYNLSDLDTGADGCLFESTIDAWENLRPVTFAQVNGGVFGGASDLLLASDFRFGGPQATMLMPAARLGLHLYGGLLQRYVSRLGLNAAKRLILTCEQFDARGMLEIGLLTHLSADERQLEAELQQTLSSVLQLAPLAVQGMKQHLNGLARGDVCMAQLQRSIEQCAASADFAEGRAALRDKRPARFKGV